MRSQRGKGQVLSIEEFHGTTPFSTFHLSNRSILVIDMDAQRGIGRLEFGFRDHDKINRVPNDDLSIFSRSL